MQCQPDVTNDLLASTRNTYYHSFHWQPIFIFTNESHGLCFQIESLDARGIQLGALFMSGVDMALFANDACGQPIPWEHCCPWMYFDGKLFQSKLIKVSREKIPLIDLCDGQVWIVINVH